MPRRPRIPDAELPWDSALLKGTPTTGFPMMDTSYNKLNNLNDLFDAAHGKIEADRLGGGSAKKRKRDDATDLAGAAKRTSMPGATDDHGDADANGTSHLSDQHPSAMAHDSGRSDSQDISTTAAAALTAHLAGHTHTTSPTHHQPSGFHSANDVGGGNDHSHGGPATDDDGQDDMAHHASAISGLLDENTDYSLHQSVLNGAPMPPADGDQQPYLTWKGEMSVERAEDGSVVHVPPGMVMGPAGFPIRPPVGSEIWHKFRRDNHKEGLRAP